MARIRIFYGDEARGKCKLHPRCIAFSATAIYFFFAPDFFADLLFGAALLAAFFFAATLDSPPIIARA
jgi:hypothetical protein